jgi:hypothetical protein
MAAQGNIWHTAGDNSTPPRLTSFRTGCVEILALLAKG